MIHKSTIKATVRKKFPSVKIESIAHKSFGVFVVKVLEERPKKNRIGILMGQTDFNISDNGVVLDEKIDWIN